jgi:hypothetical protein
VFWWRADWWVYVGEAPPVPKFELPLVVQIVASAAVGLVCGGILMGAAHYISRLLDALLDKR